MADAYLELDRSTVITTLAPSRSAHFQISTLTASPRLIVSALDHADELPSLTVAVVSFADVVLIAIAMTALAWIVLMLPVANEVHVPPLQPSNATVPSSAIAGNPGAA